MPEQQTYLTSDIIPRLAAIDVGSNSIRLVVAEALADGRYRVLDEERETPRLGRSLASTGKLDDASIADSLAALRRFLSIVQGLSVENLRAIATCAVREATNGAEFCKLVKEQLNLTLEVISSQKEAHLAFHSVRRRFDLTGKNTLLADIGGGSTELVLASGELIEAIYGTKLGAVRLNEKFGGGQALAGDDFKRMVRWVNRELRRTTEKPSAPLHLLIGSGGTFTSLAGMVMAARGQSRLPVGGCQIPRAELRHLIDRLRKMSLKQRREVPGLNPDRADIIVPGMTVVDCVMRRFKLNLLQVHSFGVRDGLLLSMIEEMQGRTRQDIPANDNAQLERFASACGVELAHAQQVARLAGEIYAGLCEHFEIDSEDRRLLESAARLQDVGYLINYDGHHKHSYHLILHSHLEGFRPEEIEIIANVARYHRGALPKRKHENFRRLCDEDQQRVLRMAAVLRLAGGLDRSHNQTVEKVEVRMADDLLELIVEAKEYPETDLWAARRRLGMFEKVYDSELAIEWAGQVTAKV
ncbi:Ppx/GppA phosphatase family protein [Bythopirellula goksoeyrii]|nr:Ppx/GppA phosphatase family protein [Bythopirellula goksoeyrii]